MSRAPRLAAPPELAALLNLDPFFCHGQQFMPFPPQLGCCETCRWSPQGCESDAAAAEREREEVEPAVTADKIESKFAGIAASSANDKRYLG